MYMLPQKMHPQAIVIMNKGFNIYITHRDACLSYTGQTYKLELAAVTHN